jgi:hypothetical protein
VGETIESAIHEFGHQLHDLSSYAHQLARQMIDVIVSRGVDASRGQISVMVRGNLAQLSDQQIRVEMLDGVHFDWRWRRNKLESLVAVDSVGVANADQWWSQHLARFRCLIDPVHVAARAERTRKDRSAVRARPHPA